MFFVRLHTSVCLAVLYYICLEELSAELCVGTCGFSSFRFTWQQDDLTQCLIVSLYFDYDHTEVSFVECFLYSYGQNVMMDEKNKSYAHVLR